MEIQKFWTPEKMEEFRTLRRSMRIAEKNNRLQTENNRMKSFIANEDSSQSEFEESVYEEDEEKQGRKVTPANPLSNEGSNHGSHDLSWDEHLQMIRSEMANTRAYVATMETSRLNDMNTFNSRFASIERLFEATIAKWEEGMEVLKSRIEDIKGIRPEETFPRSDATANHIPFANRTARERTPMTSSNRRVTDRSADFITIDGFEDDFFTTPEERRDDFDRRNSLGGGSIFSAILAPVEPSNTYMISSVTRETYAGVVLKDITLDSVGPFMNHYLNIKRKHPGQSWMIVDFCSEYTKQELTVMADTHDLPGAALGLGGAFALTDKQVLFLILEKLKARSMDDFVTRLQSLRFPDEESGIDYTKQYNYDKLFRAALSFRFLFVMRVQLLGGRAKAEHIPPLHKTGQTLGLLNLFFNAWPAGTGKALFSRHFTPEMRGQTDLKGFFKLFFSKLNVYREVKQGYDDLGSVLSSQQREKESEAGQLRFREDKHYVKREAHSNPPNTEHRQQDDQRQEQRERRVIQTPSYESNKRLWTPSREKGDFKPKSLQHMRGENEDMEHQIPIKGDSGLVPMQREADADYEKLIDPVDEQQGDEVEMMNAMERDKGDNQKGCFFKYMYGECTKQGCTMDHRDEVIRNMWKRKIWDIAKAAKSPGADILIAELQRALRDAQSASNSNTRA